jgi:hypothetical protein
MKGKLEEGSVENFRKDDKKYREKFIKIIYIKLIEIT